MSRYGRYHKKQKKGTSLIGIKVDPRGAKTAADLVDRISAFVVDEDGNMQDKDAEIIKENEKGK